MFTIHIMLFMDKLIIYILYIMTGYSMIKNNQKINQLGHNQQTILNTTKMIMIN